MSWSSVAILFLVHCLSIPEKISKQSRKLGDANLECSYRFRCMNNPGHEELSIQSCHREIYLLETNQHEIFVFKRD